MVRRARLGRRCGVGSIAEVESGVMIGRRVTFKGEAVCTKVRAKIDSSIRLLGGSVDSERSAPLRLSLVAF